jgi:hypothetical protein
MLNSLFENALLKKKKKSFLSSNGVQFQMFGCYKTSKTTEVNQCRTAAGITGIRELMTPNTNSCPWSFTRWLSFRYSENRSNTHEQATFWKRFDGSRKETKTTAARNRGRDSGWILKRRDGDLALTSRKLCAAISAVLQI